MALPQPRLRTGADPRGEQTRQRILETAIAVFAAEGYEGASTRSLAAKAGVNQPAIQYHFTSKEGLYCAAVGNIVDQVETHMGPMAAHVVSALKDRALPQKDLFNLLFEMMDNMVEIMIDGALPECCGMFIARAEIENTAALEPLGQAIAQRMMQPVAALVGRLLGQPAGSQPVLLRAMTIMGQILVFKNKNLDIHIRRELGLKDFNTAQMAMLKTMIREQTRAIITAAQKASKA